MVRQHDVPVEVAARRLEAGLDVVFRVLGDGEFVTMARAFEGDDRHLGGDGEIQRETTPRAAVDRGACGRGQRVDVGRPFVVEVQLLVVGDLHALLGPRRDGEDAHLEGLVVRLLQQAGIAADPLVTVVDLPRALLLDDLADHLLAVDPHAEVGHGCALGHGEGVERLDLPVLQVTEHLGDGGDGDAVVDRDLDRLLFDLELAAEAAVGDQQSRRVRRPRAGDDEHQCEDGGDR